VVGLLLDARPDMTTRRTEKRRLQERITAVSANRESSIWKQRDPDRQLITLDFLKHGIGKRI
jgi:hypothetical protein